MTDGRTMSASLQVARLLVFCVQLLLFFFDVATLPIYLLLQRPWIKWRKRRQIFGRRVDENDPWSPVVRVNTQSMLSLEGISTMDQLFRRAVLKFRHKKSFGTRQVLHRVPHSNGSKPMVKVLMGEYRWLTYDEVEAKVQRVAKGLSALGVDCGHHVLIFAETRFEWFVSAQACFRLGAVVITLYTTMADEELVYGINDSDVDIIVTSTSLLHRLKVLSERITKVKTVVFMEDVDCPVLDLPSNVTQVSFSRLETLGADSAKEMMSDVSKAEDMALVMYTSGSTGVPKGVMISHRNLLCMVSAFGNIYRGNPEEEMYAAYLPLAHMFELSAECAFSFMGVCIGYSSPFTLTDKSPSVLGADDALDAEKRNELMSKFRATSCCGDLTMLRPTILFVVPLLLDKVRKAIGEGCRAKGPLSVLLFRFAVRYKLWWRRRGFETPILDRLVFAAIRRQFGGRLRLMVSGSAPLSEDTHNFIRVTVGASLLQGYGLTETTGASTAMSEDDPSTGSVGAPISGVYIKLVDWEEGGYRATDQPHPRGELVIGGDFVTLGYFKNPQLTEVSFSRDDEGRRWFHTGDIGELLPNGNFKVIDRKKELVKLPFGEYVAPTRIEAKLKGCPLVDNICLCSNPFHNYLVALVVADKTQLQRVATGLKKATRTHDDLCKDPAVRDEVVRILHQFAIKCQLKGAEIPRKVHLCEEEWTPDNGLLTSGLKLKRRAVHDFYRTVIDALYQESA